MHHLERAVNAHHIAQMQREAEQLRRADAVRPVRRASLVTAQLPAALVELGDSLLRHRPTSFEPDPAHYRI